ncbi:MAG: hypothetical protein Phog2KO_17400 [Phototrophicaceae bacterium]
MPRLIQSTNNTVIDTYIEAIINIYESAFPNRIRGYYLVGSYGDNTAIANSDIDMEIVFKGALSEDEQARCDSIKESCRTLTPIHLDLPVKSEATFEQSETVALKLASQFVYGDDTRDTIPLPKMDVYLRKISIPTQRGLTFRFRSEQVSLPYDYPVANDAYYGYIPDIYKNGATPIKLWVLNVGWLATFLVVYQAKVYVPSKRHMLKLYPEHINDDWTDFITEVYENGRNKWHYQLPQTETDLNYFKSLCEQTLAFENYVAEIYLEYLKTELQDGDKSLAKERLSAFRRSE